MSDAVAVAVSGGRDSMALLHCLAHAARAAGVTVHALHVNHGLMAQAADWQTQVQRTCRRWAARGLPVVCSVRTLEGSPGRGDSVEAWARAGRYAALAAMAREARCDVVALAHHRGDQAETFLLQALRGAGAAGLASMPASAQRDGIMWVRPWLDQPRDAIEAYVRRHRIAYVEDASNADPRFARSRLRTSVMPALRDAFPGAEAALADAASRAAHAQALIDEVATQDAAKAADGDTLMLARWSLLSPARRRECLRAWLSARQQQGVSEALLDRLMVELASAATPARWPAGEGELRRYRGQLSFAAGGASTVRPEAASAPDAVGVHAVPGVAAGLRVIAARNGEGVPLVCLQGAQWRTRAGGERFQRAAGTPPRSLKKQFQAAGVPAWSRDAPLLVAADGLPIFVPGLGTDARALARPGTPRVRLDWVPAR